MKHRWLKPKRSSEMTRKLPLLSRAFESFSLARGLSELSIVDFPVARNSTPSSDLSTGGNEEASARHLV
jgi:hypothetical protein